MNRYLLDRRYWLIPLALWTGIVLASLVWSLFATQRQLHDLSLNLGREVFQMVDAMRLWNARHGGVYARLGEDTSPNPYLDHPQRDIETRDGIRLTLLNPAYMTRQVTETVRELTGIRIHMTSLKPINPGNAASHWEAEALLDFEHGTPERLELVADDDRFVARYMAPLVTREACLDCHAKQGYQVGDIRGGISVSFDAEPFAGPLAKQRRNSILIHAFSWAIVAALTVFALARWREHLLWLEAAKGEQEALVEQRTAELRREVVDRRQAETQLRLLVDASGNGIFGINADGECSFINPVALDLLGYGKADELLGRRILELIAPAGDRTLQQAFENHESLHTDDCLLSRADGTILQAEIRLDPIDRQQPAGAVVNFADISQRKAAEAQVWHQANYDTLTGLANRRLLEMRLGQMLEDATRHGERLALLFVDLDGFKTINDTHGHAIGDIVLRETAQRLLAGIRDSDLAARLAGDEFLVVLRHLSDGRHAGRIADKLVEALGEAHRYRNQELPVSASIGIALFPDDAGNATDLIKAADQAMYSAKDAGKRASRYYGSPAAPESS